jgi:2-methoxy-6-polyprenyl-1,4-benzoquinol methylase
MQTTLSRSIRLSACWARLGPLLTRHNHTQSSPQQSASSHPSLRTASFGYKTVPEESKESLVKNVFDSVASSYDLMNDATSLGVHRLWKDTFVSGLKPGRRGAARCIDVAGGTGDIALRILDYARENYADRETTVEVVDINEQMLKEGFRRFKKTMYHNSEDICINSLSLLIDFQHLKYRSMRRMLRGYPRLSSQITHMTFIRLPLVFEIARRFPLS